jgi:hypothetical protein
MLNLDNFAVKLQEVTDANRTGVAPAKNKVGVFIGGDPAPHIYKKN